MLPALILLGAAAGLSFVSVTTAALAKVDDAVAGLTSAILSTAIMLGGSLGLAVFATTTTGSRNGLLEAGATRLAAQAGGLNLAFAVAAIGALSAAVIAAFALDRDSAADPR